MPDVTLTTLNKLKQSGEKIVCLTAYDATFAHVESEAGVEVILIGDSLGMVLQGHDSTLPVSVADMAYHTAAVKRGNKGALIMADLPFMAYATLDQALANSAAACYVPECASLLDRVNGQQMAYLHYCDNETISGVEFNGQIEALAGQLDCPVVADMSSNILSKTLDVTQYGLIYGGAQKNVGPAGVTIVIIDKALLNRALSICPSAFFSASLIFNPLSFANSKASSRYLYPLITSLTNFI